MNISSIDHLVLTVKDIPASVDFYTKVLGMKEVTFGERRKALTFGDQKINLHEVGREFEPNARNPTAGSADLCLISEMRVHEVVKRLRDAGVPVEVGEVQRTGALGPMTSVYFRDPDGNLLEVSNYLDGELGGIGIEKSWGGQKGERLARKAGKYRIVFAIGILLFVTIVLFQYCGVFVTRSADSPVSLLRANAVDIGIALQSYHKDHDRYPESLEDILERLGDEEPLRYPNTTDLSMNTWEISKETWSLRWIYIPPKPNQPELPVLIAPLPHTASKSSGVLKRIVRWQDHRSEVILEKDMPKIWNAMMTRFDN